MSSTSTLKALGLNTMPNQLSAPEGSLTVASNVVINRDGVIESRRGFKDYGNAFGSSSERAKQLINYKLRILRHYSDVLEYDDGTGTFTAFAGSVLEAQTGLRIKSIESNGNLYFTTSDGIKKISAKTAADFSSSSIQASGEATIVSAGAVKGVDISGAVRYTYADQSSFFTQDSAVAYRVLWGYTDNNSNLVTGTPSQRVELYNPLLNLELQDFMYLLGALDDIGRGGSFIDDQNYVNTLKLPISASASELRINLLALTAKLDTNLLFAANFHDLGLWDASTNTPPLKDNLNAVNDVYIVTTAGTQDLGNGPIAYNISDILRYDGFSWLVDTTYLYQGTYDARATYKGLWDASTNIPTLIDGTGNQYDFYRVDVAGSQNLGSGIQSFIIGDTLQYTGTTWIKSGTPLPILQDGAGVFNGIYRVTNAGTQNFGSGDITLNVNDIVVYTNGVWSKLTTLTYIADWNASTNTPTIYDTLAKNGDFYTVSVGGTANFGSGAIVFIAGDKVLFSGKTWTNYVGTITTGAPLVISDCVITSGVCTITFSSGDPSLYMTGASKIFLAGFTPVTGTLNGAQELATVTSTTITFNTTAVGFPTTGVVTVDPNATINSNEYRSIVEPSIIDTPATNSELVSLQTYISNIIVRLNSEPITIISSVLSAAYIAQLDVTTTATVDLTITIPQDITSNYFYQIYRTQVFVATGTTVLLRDVFPNDEMQLVYEAFPTAAELAAGVIHVQDVTPDAFRGANLYTNAATGEGILQSNDIPPFAKDINVFKNSVFYANTRTRHRKDVSLIGVQNMIDDIGLGITPTLTIATSSGFSTYSFIVGQIESFTIACNAGSTLNAAGPASYFNVNGINNAKKYYLWYKIGTATDPMIAGREGFPIIASAADTNIVIAEKTRDEFNRLNNDFIASSITNTITVTYNTVGFVDDITDGNTGFVFTVTNQGTDEKASKESTLIACVADVAGSLAGKYFTLNTAFNQEQYYVWFKVNGVGTDPAIAGKIGILINLATNDSATSVATKIKTELVANYSTKVIATSSTSNLTIVNYRYGPAVNATAGTSGFTITVQDEGALNVLLSTNVSPAIAVTETSNSLTRIVNQNQHEAAYVYYLSGAQEVPGKMNFEARSLVDTIFYIIANNSNTGDSFSPSFDPVISISSISTGSPTTMLVTTSTPHKLSNFDNIVISGTNSIPSIDGYRQITYVSPTTFRVNVTVTTSGNKGGFTLATSTQASSNQLAKNRIYYSKLQQPEAVPILNYLELGAKDKEIVRIFPLRDSLFVFKEDGLYRISGESIPFNSALFDSSCILIAPDSVSSVDNVIYGWTRQGVASATESGTRNVSRPIDIDLLPIGSSNYPNFKNSTWGIGYESDKTYTVYTNTAPTDTSATIGYKYNSLTNTWTTTDRDFVCGVMNFNDDKMYVGAGDSNTIEQERKSFSRTDYADREYSFALSSGNYIGDTIALDSVANITAYDVMLQTQTVTVFDFNMILKKLDIDTGVTDTNYYSLLKQSAGANMRTAIIGLANKLDADAGVTTTDYFSTISDKTGAITAIATGSTSSIITSAGHGLFTGRKVIISGSNSVPDANGQFIVTVIDANTFEIDGLTILTAGTSGLFTTLNNDFDDLKACYNKIMTKLNADPGVNFSNYRGITQDTIQESLIVSVNASAKRITVQEKLDFVAGPFTVFKSINCELIYSPHSFGGDPISLKHIREAQLFFEALSFTKGTISFATDLLPMFEEVEFTADGDGKFGSDLFGSGFFGGASNSAPIRTYIPRNSQRCRYMIVKFNHKVAREKWSLFGISLTGETQLSTRAYK